MENCEAMQALISRMLDEDLTAQEQRKLAEHLETCPDCRAVYRAFPPCPGNCGAIWPSRRRACGRT